MWEMREVVVLVIGILVLGGSSINGATDPTDASALRAMYSSLNSPSQLTKWSSTGGDPCGKSWKGITCSGSRVTEIKLSGLGLSGSMGYQLATMTSVTIFDISNNNLGNQIIYQLPPNVTQLNLAGNGFTGVIPYSISEMTSLKYLNLGHNQLAGQLNDMFGWLSSLSTLDLSFNSLMGNLPESFSSLTSMNSMYLQNNQFTGTIDVLANLPLNDLNVANNNFNGWIPAQLKNINLQKDDNSWSSGPAPPPPSGTPPASNNNGNHNSGSNNSPTGGDGNGGGGKKSGIGGGGVAGIVISILIVGAIVAFFLMRRRSRKPSADVEKLDSQPSTSLASHEVQGAVCDGIGVLLMSIILCYTRLKTSPYRSIIFWRMKTNDNRNLEDFIANYGSLSPKRYTYSDVKKMTHSFRDKLGQGGYGRVYKGKLLDNRLVAVKLLDESKGNGEEFINEVASISRTSHVNIVCLLGFCVEGRKRALIYEFMPNGSLEKFIYGEGLLKTNSHLGWEKLYQISIGIARGLEYLHRGCNQRILHFDIKPHNILLDEDFCPKISDFGLAKLFTKKESIISMLDARGTIGYIAPEVFSKNFGEVSHKSDVYSYGMMALEMVGGRKNVDVGTSHTSKIYFPHWVYKRLELNEELVGFQGDITQEENEMARKMILVGLWCIQIYPSQRPSMSKVVEMLEGSMEALEIPPRPYLYSPSRSPTESFTT